MAETPNLNQPQVDPLKELYNAAYGTGIDMADPKPIDLGINENLVGNFRTGPNPSSKQINPNLGEDILNYMSQGDNWAFDSNRFAKVYDYGADWKHTNFERYYSHDMFKELGFSPYRDNDATYNAKGSAWDDFMRATEGNVRLFGHGFISMEEGGESAAEAMERINATYGSTRGGVGGFVSNLALSAGYTQGIMGRIILEEAALALATLGSGFTASGATVPLMGVEAGRGIKGLIQGVRGLGKTINTFHQLDNIDKARQLFNAVKGIPGAIGRGVAPNTMRFVEGVREGTYAFKGFKDLKSYASAFKGVGSMYQDYRQMRLAYSEADMEGEMLENKMNNDLINEFYNTHGYMPTGKDAEDIYRTSVNAGTSNKMLNAGIIYFSNKLLFGKLFRGIPTAGELMSKTLTTNLGSLKRMPIKLGENFLKSAENGFLARTGRAVISSPYSPLSKSYWLTNFVEGLQEMAQDASASGFEEYYKNIYRHPMQEGYAEMAEALARGTGKQFSPTGFETFASGFLTGALVGPGQHIITEVIPTHGRRFVPKNLREKYGITSYEDLVNRRNESKANTLKSINEVLRDPYKMDMSAKDYLIQVMEHNKKVDEALRSGDPVKIEEAKNEMYTDHLHRVFRTGNANLLRDYFKNTNKMSDEELAEAFNQPLENAKELRERLTQLNDKVNKFEKIYNAVEQRFPNIHDETVHKKNSPEYFAALRRSHSFEQAKQMAMFAMSYFQDATQSQKDAMQYLMNNKPLENMNPSDISTLFDTKAIDNEVQTLDKEIRVLKKGDATQQALAKQKEAKRNDLNNFKNSAMYFEKVSELFRKSEGKEEVVQDLTSLASISNGAVIVNEKGKKFTVVSTSGDVLKLQDENGKKYTRKTRKGLKLVTPGEEVEVALDKNNPVEYAIAEMYKHFKSYLKNTANVNDEVLMDSNVEKAFAKVREFYYYKNNAKSMAGVVNALHDARGMMALAKRLETANQALESRFNEYAEEAYKASEDAKDYKALLNALYDKGFKLVLPEGMQSIMKQEVPKQFVDEAAETVFDVSSDPAKYKAASDIVTDFFEYKKRTAEQDAAEKAKKQEEEKLKREAEEKKKTGTPVATAPPKEEEIKKAAVKKKVEYDTPYQNMPEELRKSVLEGARVAGITAGVIDENATDEEIELSEWFRNEYLKYKHVNNLIDKYNSKEGFEEVEEAPTTKAGTFTPTTPYGTPTGPELTTATTTDTKTEIDLISTPVSKIVEELSKLNTLNEKLNWLKDNNLLSPININGKTYNIIDYSDRVMVLMKVGKYNIPFYISTGQAGKKTVKAGNWYAVFGIGVEKGWINKGSEEQINNNYGFTLFEKLSKILNEGIGTIQSREDNGNGKLKDGIGFLSDSKEDLEAFNNNMNLPTKPAGKNTDTKDFYDHVNSTLSLLNNELKQLAASEGAKPTKKAQTPLQEYKNNKESKPSSGLKPQIIYSTSTTGKTPLSKKYNDVLDADFLLYEYLVEKGIIKEDTDPDTFEDSVQKAGKDFYNYLTALKSSKGEEAVNNTYREIIGRIQDLVREGNVVLTSNYWMLNQDMNRFVTKDVDKIAEQLMARDPLLTKEVATENAQKIIERETKAFKGRPVKEIPVGKTIEDMLFAKETGTAQEKLIKEIDNAQEIADVRSVEDKINMLSKEDLLQVNLKELMQAINDKKLVLLRKFDFDSINDGDTFMDKNGNVLTITYKTKTRLLAEYDDADGGTVDITKENMNDYLAYRYIDGVDVTIPEEPISDEAKQAANQTKDNASTLTKQDDVDANKKAKDAKKGEGFNFLKNKKDDLNDNC